MEAARQKREKYLQKKKWRSSEVSMVDEESEVKSAERIALERQDSIAQLSRDQRMAKAAEGKGESVEMTIGMPRCLGVWAWGGGGGVYLEQTGLTREAVVLP
jgi:hypothetical protein